MSERGNTRFIVRGDFIGDDEWIDKMAKKLEARKREPLELRGGVANGVEWNATIDRMEQQLEAHNEGESNRPSLVAKALEIAAYTVAGVVFGGVVAYILAMVGLFLASR